MKSNFFNLWKRTMQKYLTIDRNYKYIEYRLGDEKSTLIETVEINE